MTDLGKKMHWYKIAYKCNTDGHYYTITPPPPPPSREYRALFRLLYSVSQFKTIFKKTNDKLHVCPKKQNKEQKSEKKKHVNIENRK